MYFKSQKIPLLILAILSLVFSRTFFALLNDPEGPNVPIVVGMAVIIYVISLLTYVFAHKFSSRMKFWLAVLIQAVLVFIFYFCLR